ncbi:AMP-binding enzyme [Teladorsagia circumcincta]|uniref:AMP-binding enzyme n=1 Tax=Teladorsagia circumcincta TaxID=45464 RepID=A0A2G9U679_TELCI|nr:AMP-binding enzyme [Teladorsagia circumcincta]
MHLRNDLFFNKALPEFLQKTRELFVKFSLFVRLDKIEVSDGTADFGTETMEKDRPESIGYAWLVQIDRPEDSVTSESDLTAIIVKVLQLALDLNKPIKSIEQIQYPVACYGGLKLFVESIDGIGNLNIYGSYGSRCGSWTNICVEDEQPVKKINQLELKSFSDSPTIKCLAKIGIDCDCIDRHETFTSMGLDSLQCAELEMALQSEFPNYSIPSGIAMTKNTVAEMDTYLKSCLVACEINNKDDVAYLGHVPLSPQQRGLVFMNELEPLTRAQFNEPVVFAMNEAIFDERRFSMVLNTLVMRHSVLRTKYYANDPSYTIVQYLSRLSAAIAEAKSADVPLDVLVLLVLDNVQPPSPDSDIVLLDCSTQFAKYEQTCNPILVGTISEQLRSSANRIGVPVLVPKPLQKGHGRFLNRTGLNDLAYITCTSGTTGIPKMVCTEFSGHSNLAAAYTRTYLLHNYSHTYQVVNYGFDIFFADLTKTLVNGASMTLAEGLIPNLLEMDGVTNAYIMPAYLSSLTSSDTKRLAFLESIHFGGEAIQPSALRLLLQIGARIYHEHGVTEQTVYTTCNRMDVCSPIPEIGAPYRNLHHFLRDEDGQLLPEKYRGIYYINGCGLFRGYYDNHKLTANTLKQGFFGKEMRTGDIVKYEYDRLHFQGRSELQVKIRGRLIDLLEASSFLGFPLIVFECISLDTT